MSQSRRNFLAYLALGTTASAFPLLKEIEKLDIDFPEDSEQLNSALSWVDQVKGSKKLFTMGVPLIKGSQSIGIGLSMPAIMALKFPTVRSPQ